MSRYDDDLLRAARRLLTRRSGQRGTLPTAHIRRSISTSYYALFHFLTEEAGLRLIGTNGALRRRRRILARAFVHRGIKTSLDKIGGATIDRSVEDFFRDPIAASGTSTAPAFAREAAKTFADAQAKRHDADYDLNKPLSEADARLLHRRVRRTIGSWRDATTPSDRDFKHTLCMLMLLKGRLRQDD